MSMITVLLIIALLGTLVLVFHIALEINGLEKKMAQLIDSIRKHYGLKEDREPNK